MAKLHFYFSSMNAGKSTTLLQSNYNYIERGMTTALLAPSFDDRGDIGYINSRIGLQAKAHLYNADTDIFKLIKNLNSDKKINCILVDEAQFLTKKQVLDLTDIVDYLFIPVLAYGLRNDFQAEPFEGSKYLLSWADEITEIKTICHCGKKATHVLRVDENGIVAHHGSQIQIGGNENYVAVCRLHFKKSEII